MALIKSKTERRTTGEYWLIEQRNTNTHRPDYVVTLACYASKAARDEDSAAELWQPTGMTAQFNFTPGDHPLTELEPDAINPAWIDTPLDVESHMIYLHIRAVGLAALEIPAEERTPNEQAAAWFADALDDVP